VLVDPLAAGRRARRVAKQVKGRRAETRVEALPDGERRRLPDAGGEKVTDAARAGGGKLLADGR
jgi:hypothetical protein